MLNKLEEEFDVKPNSAVFFMADEVLEKVQKIAGQIRIELGKRDLDNGIITVARRDTREKITTTKDVEIVSYIKNLLETIQNDMYNRAKTRRDNLTFEAHNLEEM